MRTKNSIKKLRKKPAAKARRKPKRPDFKEFLASAPLEGIDLTRERDYGRRVELLTPSDLNTN